MAQIDRLATAPLGVPSLGRQMVRAYGDRRWLSALAKVNARPPDGGEFDPAVHHRKVRVCVLRVYARRMNRLLARMGIVNAVPLFGIEEFQWKLTVYPEREHCCVRSASGHRGRERIAG